MRQRSSPLSRAWLLILTIYAVLGGATTTALLSPAHRFMMLGLLGLTVVLWLGARWRGHWTWQRTPLDLAIAVWILVLLITSAANSESWRRIVTGLWFIAVYIGLWFILQDLIANGQLRREILIEAWLLAGGIVLVTGYLQLVLAFLTHSRGAGNDLAPILGISRVVSSLENPNILANFLTILIPLGAARWVIAERWLARLLWTLYELAAFGLLLLTFGRGGWISTIIAMLAFGLLLSVHQGRITLTGVRAWWQSRPASIRTVAAIGLILILLLAIVALGVVVSARASTVLLRAGIYDVAIKLFAEKPITGSGLFTFGKGLLRLGSSPPDEAHNNGHNVLLNIAAELGLLGLVALTVSIIAVGRALARNWLAMQGAARVQLIGMIAALVGFAAMHQFDILSITMVIALPGLCVSAAAVAPIVPKSMSRVLPAAARFLTPALVLGWLLILVFGLWDSLIYQDYVKTVGYGLTSGDFRGAADQLQGVTHADPAMPVYDYNRGYFLGAAAWKGDSSTLDEAIREYQRFLSVEPSYAPGWANLSALYTQMNQTENALDTMRHAAQLTPRSWVIAMNLGLIEEAAGQLEAARADYRQVLAIAPDVSLYPEWDQTALRRDLIKQESPPLTRFGQTAHLILSDHIEEAAALWKTVSSADQVGTPWPLIDFVLALKGGHQSDAEAQLEVMRNSAQQAYDFTLVSVCEALLARQNNDASGAQKAIANARALTEPSPLRYADDRVGALAYTQYWRVALPQYLLPQLYNPAADPLTMRLIQALSAP